MPESTTTSSSILVDSKQDIIRNWYKSSKIDYISPFMKLWISFNGWYNIKLSTIKRIKDSEAMKNLKENNDLKEMFKQTLRLSSDEGREFRKSLSVLIEETKNQPLLNNKGKNVFFQKSDITSKIKDNFQKKLREIESSENSGDKITLAEFVQETNGLLLDDTENVIITTEEKTIFTELLDVLYQVRCHIFHGSLDTEDKRTQRLVKNAYVILTNMYKPELGGI